MDKKKYILVRCDSMKDFEERINENFADGYELTDFQVVSDAGEPVGFFGVMELKNPQKPQRFYLEPMVAH